MSIKEHNLEDHTYTLVKSFKNGRTDYWYTIAKSEGEALRHFEKKFSRRWLCGCALYLGDALFEGAVFINSI